MRVFLGGTCNGSKWRDVFTATLHADFFNPVVPDWTPDMAVLEDEEKDKCDLMIYTLTPKMSGCYSIAELVADSFTRPFKTLLCILEEDDGTTFSETNKKSLDAVTALVVNNGVKFFQTLDSLERYVDNGR